MRTIGVFFGSKSPEHDVSIVTAQLVMEGLRTLGHRVVPIYIDKEGRWFTGDKLGNIAYFQKLVGTPRGVDEIALDLSRSTGRLIFKKRTLWSQTVVIDIAFPTIHGRNGEDGTIQGMFELCNVPYVGCDVTSSAVAMDKVITKLLYRQCGFPTTPFVHFTKRAWEQKKDTILHDINTQLHMPVFVKPARLGSSIGITKVEKEADITDAIEVALHYDDKALVEDGVVDVMDITCAVLGNENPKPSLVQETAFHDTFLSYDEKYLAKGGTQLGNAQDNIIIPARLDSDTAKRVRQLAVDVFTAFGCTGIARVDFLYDRTAKTVYVNEINTLPGTLYHHLWKASGVPFGELLTQLLRCADERHENKNQLTVTFNSDILRQINWSRKLRPGASSSL